MKLLSFLFLAMSLALGARAETDKVSIALDVVFWGDWPRHTVEVATAQGPRTIGLIPYDNSQFFVYEGPPEAVFYRRAPAASPGAKPVPVPLFKAQMPSGVKRALLVIFVPGSQDANYRAMVIPCDDDTFPANSILAWNGMPEPILARFGSITTTLAASAPNIFKVSPSGETLQVMLAGKFRGKQRLLYSSVIPFLEGRRNLVILYNSNPVEEGRVDVFTYDLPSTSERQASVEGEETKAPKWKESLPYKADYQPPPRPELSVTGANGTGL